MAENVSPPLNWNSVRVAQTKEDDTMKPDRTLSPDDPSLPRPDLMPSPYSWLQSNPNASFQPGSPLFEKMVESAGQRIGAMDDHRAAVVALRAGAAPETPRNNRHGLS